MNLGIFSIFLHRILLRGTIQSKNGQDHRTLTRAIVRFFYKSANLRTEVRLKMLDSFIIKEQ